MTDDDVKRVSTKRQALVSTNGIEEALADDDYDRAHARWERLGERIDELRNMDETNETE